ncbi:MAG TPA: hypothetical protein VFI08_11220 [Spirochaetia bacterium]|nr:hypothetical protein [Spirochaetia bacterium]
MGGATRAATAFFLSLLWAAAGWAQSPAGSAAPAPPASFRGLTLGMSLDQVKTTLKADALFRYRGDPDVSFLPQTSQYLIECEGTSFIRRAYFQFADGRLFIMILVLDEQRLDHYSLFSTLSAKYGPPTGLSPQEAVWQSDPVRFSLERPLTVKYVDNKTFAAILSQSGTQKDLEQLSREKFLEQF